MTSAVQFPLNSREWAKWLESRVATVERSINPTATRIARDIASELVFSPTSPAYATVPVGGTIGWYGANDPPASGGVQFMIPDGRAISRTTYAVLFALIGTTYGAGDGSTTFNIPNEKGRVAVGLDGAQAEFNSIGETGGAKTHTLTTSEMPSHSHAPSVGTAFMGYVGSGGNQGSSGTTMLGGSRTASEGGGGAHNNLQPYIVRNSALRVM